MLKKIKKLLKKVSQKPLKSSSPVLRFIKPILGVAVVIFILYYFRAAFIAAVVNNRPITRYSLDRDLEKQVGRQVLENKIVETLIEQEIAKQKVSVPQAEIDQKIKEIEDSITSQGQKLETLLAMQGQTRKDLEKQIQMQIAVEKILGKDVQIDDKQIADYFEQNKSTYPKDTKLEDKKEEIKTSLYQQTVSEKFQAWAEELKKNAKIYYFLKF